MVLGLAFLGEKSSSEEVISIVSGSETSILGFFGFALDLELLPGLLLVVGGVGVDLMVEVRERIFARSAKEKLSKPDGSRIAAE